MQPKYYKDKYGIEIWYLELIDLEEFDIKNINSGPYYRSFVTLDDKKYLVVLHREDGPAIISKRYKEFRLYGKIHRVDGPAVCLASGEESYWLMGIRYSDLEAWFKQLTYEQKIVALYNPENF